MWAMAGKILARFGNAATIALAGYEIGSHTNEQIETKIIRTESIPEQHRDMDHNMVIVVIGIIILIALFLAIAAKLFVKRRPVA